MTDTNNCHLLIGKTIVSAQYRGIKDYDDMPYLDLVFSDGSKITIKGSYGGYTGKSEDEYYQYISVGELTNTSEEM